LNCEGCSEDLKKKLNCEGISNEPVFRIDEEEYYSCPLNYISKDLIYAIQEHRFYKMYSISKEFKDVNSNYVDMIFTYERLLAEFSEKLDKLRKNQNNVKA